MISWQDARTGEEVEDIKSKISPRDFYDITSMPLNTLWILTKILWLRKNEPENWDRVDKVVQLQDYVLSCWGIDGYYNDISDAGFSGFWDPYSISWSDTLLDTFSIDKSILPTPARSGTLIGKISKHAAQETDLREETPICVGLGDQNSAAVGAGITAPGHMSVSLGNWLSGRRLSGFTFPRPYPTEYGYQPRHLREMATGRNSNGVCRRVPLVPG